MEMDGRLGSSSWQSTNAWEFKELRDSMSESIMMVYYWLDCEPESL